MTIMRWIGVVMICAAVAGCARISESRLNPFNWFGRGEEVTTEATQASVVQQTLVQQVITLRAEKAPGGAIIRATGLPPRQGFFDGALVQIPSTSAGTLSFEFQIEPPLGNTAVGTQQSREVLVGLFLSDQTLEGVSRIQVNAASNALSIRR